MTVRKLPIALVAATLAAAPVAAQAAPVERAAAPAAADESELRGTVLWIIVAIGVIIGAILLLDDKNDPVSS